MTERLHFHFSLLCIGEGNGNPLQCSCLENPRDGGAWWAAVYGVAQSWTQLKWLSSSSSSSSKRVLGSLSVNYCQNCFEFMVSIDREWTCVKMVLLSITQHANRNCDLLALVEIYYFWSLVLFNSVNLEGEGEILIQCLISLSQRVHMALLVLVFLVSGHYTLKKKKRYLVIIIVTHQLWIK